MASQITASIRCWSGPLDRQEQTRPVGCVSVRAFATDSRSCTTRPYTATRGAGDDDDVLPDGVGWCARAQVEDMGWAEAIMLSAAVADGSARATSALGEAVYAASTTWSAAGEEGSTAPEADSSESHSASAVGSSGSTSKSVCTCWPSPEMILQYPKCTDFLHGPEQSVPELAAAHARLVLRMLRICSPCGFLRKRFVSPSNERRSLETNSEKKPRPTSCCLSLQWRRRRAAGPEWRRCGWLRSRRLRWRPLDPWELQQLPPLLPRCARLAAPCCWWW
mmetsp:Transcript_18713/g.59709  ORF Transcript_18713/g.59709 Transcript_18713/m.59709 type:complete len:278 (-) Transcript_18713:1132-1965(-)